ncbi:ribosomal RNA large subunit methyltransferase N [Ruminococcus sp. CAG:579]|uniref:23S rRNA (adenine(2503)-C(2))-methyltransferase RlmN n=1 Tax=Ruminococcus sp. 210702-SL.1.03 TaxID=2883233 RepID=UPI000334F777|nr:23S rRNA (adenine(2503)-C(2))-methyltransferase RlmN [Ruminococcus sp. 210702-SL.1.03]MCB6615485.1 23S rRNA (adenine(2503)-C(2))-methyltransferase RlmN [Ruminococcus sp. 210702-SL.1.03]CDA72796.1 ribosomal RNA large subunit methyltransferase N [Ruminococcus sp. CAG:579]
MEQQKTDILSLYPEELEAEILAMGEKKFRAKQIFEWLHVKNVDSFDKMTNLSAQLRARLEEKFCIKSLFVCKTLESCTDNTVKYLYGLDDGNHIESVLMEYSYGNTICVSTQVGCKMGCRFCASTIAGYKRDLTAGEILGQIYTAQRESGRKISGVVLMGIGEPMDNYDNVVRFLKLLSCPQGFGMSLRHVSVSTCGIVPRIYELAELNLGITLSISLHAPDNAERSAIMPVNDRWDINELMAACRHYFAKTGRRISFEYALIDGHNDTREDAKKLAALLSDFVCHVNIIPVNKIKERSFTSDRKAAHRFQQYLNELGINATVRRTLGADIEAACGQLRREYEMN